MSGIYMIRCRPTGEYYVGATSRTFALRFNEHRTQLSRGVCSIPLLQDRATRYGVEALDFIPLKEIGLEDLAAKEKEALTILKPALNTCHVRSKGSYARWEKVEIEGKLYRVTEAARAFGLEPNTIRLRIKRGLTGMALVTPAYSAPRKPYIRRA